MDKYFIHRIIKKDKNSSVWNITDVNKNTYILKKIHKKNIYDVYTEINFQNITSSYDISPTIFSCFFKKKSFVMEKLDNDLLYFLKKNNFVIPLKIQKRIVEIFRKLDTLRIFHGDSNLHNFMFKNNQLYIIDYGMSEKIDENFIKKNKTENPNMDLMGSVLILKLKKLGVKPKYYKYILENISLSIKNKYKL
jgi:predicted Ser/Thr protein kinase